MAQQTINLGSAPDDGTGDTLRAGGDKINDNFDELYAAIVDILNGFTATGDIIVPDEAYDATNWNGSLEVPTKNAVRDKIEALGSVSVSDAAYGVGWDGDTTAAPSKNAVYDKIEAVIAGGGYSDEQARDAIGAALVAGLGITITVNDGADTITIGRASGTSFPGSPSTGDRYLRTDRNIEYFYDGTRWLSTQQFRVSMSYGDNPTIPLTATKAAAFRFDNPEGGVWSIYVESLHFGTYLTAGSTVWTIATTVLGIGTSLGSTTTTGDAATTASNHIVTVNAVFANTVAAFQTDFTKTSGSGNVYIHGSMLYRLVG